MSPTRATDASEKGEVGSIQGVRDLSIKANWRTIAITLYMGISLFEYGFDKGAIAGFQAMPGFLQVFGYQSANGSWNIHVSDRLSMIPLPGTPRGRGGIRPLWGACWLMSRSRSLPPNKSSRLS